MLSVVIDTSTERGVIALLETGLILFQENLPFGHQNSKNLLPFLKKAFNNIDKSPQDASSIIVGIGPGSYTGIRVGATVAKTLSYSLNIPLIGVSSMVGFIPHFDSPFAAIVDAKIGGVYLLTGQQHNGTVTYKNEPFLCPLEELPPNLSNIDVIVTPHPCKLQPRLKSTIPQSFHWIERPPCPQQLYHIAKTSHTPNNDGTLEILYLKKQHEAKRI